MLWNVTSISLGVFGFSFKNILIWDQNGCTFGHSQNKCILDADVVLQRTLKLNSSLPFFFNIRHTLH